MDLAKREVRFDEIEPMTYDYLVLGLGARVNFFGTPGAAEHAFPMYTLPDAVRLKRISWSDGRPPTGTGDSSSDGALNVVVVGGGPTGVESAGALAELYRTNFAADYPKLPQKKARIILVEAGTTLFPMFKANLREYAKRALEKRGVEVKLGEVVASVTPTRVTLKSGKMLKAHTLVWGAGLRANPIARVAGLELRRGDRVEVGNDLSIPQHPEVFAPGDIGWITEGRQTRCFLSSARLRCSRGNAPERTSRGVAGKKTHPFDYKDKGTMATIGRGAGVIQMPGGRTMKGKSASLAWGAVHLALLSTGEDRAKAVIDWTWAGFTHERGAPHRCRHG